LPFFREAPDRLFAGCDEVDVVVEDAVLDVEDAPDADEDSAADFALPSAGASFSFASASRRSSMVAHSLMAVEADRRSRDPSATNSRAAREEKPAHDMARNARYRRSCDTTFTVVVHEEVRESHVGRRARGRVSGRVARVRVGSLRVRFCHEATSQLKRRGGSARTVRVEAISAVLL
jgi:hypothetical protein